MRGAWGARGGAWGRVGALGGRVGAWAWGKRPLISYTIPPAYRHVGATDYNEVSSRSHTLFRMVRREARCLLTHNPQIDETMYLRFSALLVVIPQRSEGICICCPPLFLHLLSPLLLPL